MIDVIIIAVIAMAVFFIVRRELRRFRKGQCCSGCSGCNCGCKSREESSVKKNKRAQYITVSFFVPFLNFVFSKKVEYAILEKVRV